MLGKLVDNVFKCYGTSVWARMRLDCLPRAGRNKRFGHPSDRAGALEYSTENSHPKSLGIIVKLP